MHGTNNIATAGSRGDPFYNPGRNDLGLKGHRVMGNYLMLGNSDDKD